MNINSILLHIYYRFELNNFRMSEHAGTHVDSPTHFSQTGWDPSEIPLDKLFRVPAVVVNITARASTNPKAQLLPGESISL